MRSNVFAAAALVAAATLSFSAYHAAAAEYHWAPTGPPSWAAPGSWSPARITPLTTDRLVFDGGGSATVSSIPTATIGQLVVANNTQVTFNAGVTGNSLTIGGDTGPDLEIAAGSTLTFTSANAFSVNLATGATAAIAGGFTAAGGAHRLQALDVDAIVFTSGGVATAAAFFTGNLFGLGTGASALNSVRFQSGSTYVQASGANPFGVGQPSSIVTFDHGSLYRLDSSIVPSMSGRTYGNFEYNGSGAVTGAGSAAATIDSIVVNSGTLSLELTGVLNVRGSIRVGPGALLNLGPLSGTTNYRLNGSSMQVLLDSTPGVAPGIVLRPSVTLSLDNPAGFTDFGNSKRLVFPGVLEFVQGVAHIRASFSTTGSSIGASQSTGWIDGIINPYPILQASPNVTLPIGTAATYMPVDISLHGMTHVNRLGAVLHDDRSFNPTYYSGAQLDTTKLVFPNYLVAVLDSTGWTNFDAVMHFAAAEYGAGANPLAFVARKQSYSFVGPTDLTWRSTALGARTSTSLQVLGVTRNLTTDTNFNFAVGEPTIVRVSVLDSSVVEGSNPLDMRIHLSEPAIDPVSFDVQLASGTATHGVDFGDVTPRISIAPGTTEFILHVPILPDNVPEADETFTVTLSNPFLCEIDRDVATGTILDDDDTTPPVVSALFPNGGETFLLGDNVNLQWSATDAGGVASVDLELSRDDGGSWETIANSLPNTGHHGWVATGPLTQLARLRVTATDSHGHAAADVSDAAWAIWSADGVEDELPHAFALSFASANPGSGTSRIRYALPRDQDVRMSIVDVRGRVVAVLANGPEPAGVHVASWDPREAPAGVYFVRFRTPEWKSQLRLVHLR